MKALIVDDERHAREAIRMLIDWEDFGIGKVMEADNVGEAIRLVESERPEIVFTDMMMPNRDGIELLSWIYEKSPTSKIIVVSGYKDFYFVRNTVKYGGMDYVLKPIDPDQIQEVLGRAVGQWQKETKARDLVVEREIRGNKIRFLYWDQFFSKLLYHPSIEEGDKKELIAEFELSQLPDKVQVVVMDTVWIHPNILRKLSGNTDLLYFILHNIANEYLSQERAGIAFQDLNRKGIALLVWKTGLTCVLLERINRGLLDAFGIRMHFGIGEPCAFPMNLLQSYDQAGAALSARNLRDCEMNMHYRPAHRQVAGAPFSRHEQPIELALCSGIPDRIREIVSEWFQTVEKQDGVTTRFYEEWWKEFVVFVNRWIADHLDGELHLDWPEPFYIPLDSDGRFSFAMWKERIVSTFLLMSKTLTDKKRRDKHVVYDIAQYLEKDYKKDFNLQELANLFGLSKEHISRKFKQELKLTLSDYLTGIRMKHAKTLLASPNMKICAVAALVGYQDEKYFGKVFKKSEGLTPVEYRKLAEKSLFV
jgi:two-component system response regulator YesN